MVESNIIDIEERINELNKQQAKTIELLESIQKELRELRLSTPSNQAVNEGISNGSRTSKERRSKKVTIGDRVEILNPRGNQPIEGTVVRITSLFVFIKSAASEKLIRRAPSNVRKL